MLFLFYIFLLIFKNKQFFILKVSLYRNRQCEIWYRKNCASVYWIIKQNVPRISFPAHTNVHWKKVLLVLATAHLKKNIYGFSVLIFGINWTTFQPIYKAHLSIKNAFKCSWVAVSDLKFSLVNHLILRLYRCTISVNFFSNCWIKAEFS